MTPAFSIARIRDNYIKILMIWASAFAIAFVFDPASARAAGGLIVTPTLLEFEEGDRYASLTLINQGEETQTFRVSIVNRRMRADGKFEPTSTPAEKEGFADDFIRYSPRQVTLVPDVPQTIRVMLRLPSDVAKGEYRSHMLFEQLPNAETASADGQTDNGLDINITARFGMTIPVIVRRGDLTASAQIEKVEPTTLPNGAKGLAMKINRSGDKSVRGNLRVLADGEEVGLIRNLAIYLSTPTRTIEIPLKREDLSGRDVVVEYRQRPKDGGDVIAARTVQLP